MLIALNEKNQLVRAGTAQSNNFICPACLKAVKYRKGKYTVAHFAHLRNESCGVDSEKESAEHLLAKEKLFNAFSANGLKCQLEKYFPNILQRADLFFTWNQKNFAIEVQCSSLPIEKIAKRTSGYYKSGTAVIWIFHKPLVYEKRRNQWQIPKFVQTTLNSMRRLYLFDVKKEKIFVLSHLVPSSPLLFFANVSVMTINEFLRQLLAGFTRMPVTFLGDWRNRQIAYRMHSLRFLGLKTPFGKRMYELNFTLGRFPFFVGIPLPSCWMLATAPFEWQGSVFLVLLKLATRNKKNISRKQFFAIFSSLIKKKEIIVRYFPEDLVPNFVKVAQEFWAVLVYVGFLKQRTKEQYFINFDNLVYNCSELDFYRFLSKKL